MLPIVADETLVARCGLYCGACGAYRRGRCPGCAGNEKATWCQVRSCCHAAGFQSCAECTTHPDPSDCRKYNNIIARVFGWIFRSNRRACILQIRQQGLTGHAQLMAQQGRQSLPR